MLGALIFIYFTGLVVGGIMGPLIAMDMDLERDFSVPEGVAMFVLWPFSVVIVTLLGVKRLLLGSDDDVKMTRKQRKELEFLKQKAAVSQGALEAQREFERLITKE